MLDKNRDLALDTFNFSLDDLDLSDIEVKALDLEETRGLTEMGASLGVC